MTLFFSPGACSLALRIALNEAGLNYKTEKVDIRKKEYSGGNYYKVNPKGLVPALEIENGEVLTEAAVCLQYVADQKIEKHLMPRVGTLERYRAQEWLNYVATEVHKGFGPLWNSAYSDETKTIVKDLLAKKFAFLEETLKQRPFLTGDQFTVADGYLFTVIRWSGHLKVDVSKFPSLLAHFERVKSRPAVMESLKQEGLA
jgi:glutathione S-transferase